MAANGALRDALQRMCRENDVQLEIAPRELCTDNAAMAALGWERLDQGHTAQLDVDVTPGLIRRIRRNSSRPKAR